MTCHTQIIIFNHKNEKSRFSFHVKDNIICYNGLEVERSAARLFLFSLSLVRADIICKADLGQTCLPQNDVTRERPP